MSTAAAAAFWSEHDGGDWWCSRYRGTSSDETRGWVVEAVRALAARSVFEIGCHCGPLLQRLRQELPGIVVAGIDANAHAAQAAQAAGLSVACDVAPMALHKLPDQFVDVVASTYCLAYIAPEDLVATLRQCLRLAVRGLVFVEPSAGPGVPVEAHRDGSYLEWRHEYLDALDIAAREFQGRVEMRRIRKATGSNVNAVIIARLTRAGV